MNKKYKLAWIFLHRAEVSSRFIVQLEVTFIIKTAFAGSCGLLEESREKPQKGRKKNAESREKIVALLSEDGKLSAMALAGKIGISAKSVEKHLANLKADGIIERIGPPKGGHWKVK